MQPIVMIFGTDRYLADLINLAMVCIYRFYRVSGVERMKFAVSHGKQHAVALTTVCCTIVHTGDCPQMKFIIVKSLHVAYSHRLNGHGFSYKGLVLYRHI